MGRMSDWDVAKKQAQLSPASQQALRSVREAAAKARTQAG